MANKDHSLDGRIVDAALAEFMQCGYEKASLRKIAAAADVTVGAIYTRYKTKDSLFCSLVEPLIRRIGQSFQEIRADYYKEAMQVTLEHMAQAMQQENEAILHLLFDDYDRAVLLLCRSRGSSLEHFFDQIVQSKIEETAAFYQSIQIPHPPANVMKLLITAQFHMYFQVIEEGFCLGEARQVMDAVMVYNTSGWLALMNGTTAKTDKEEQV